MAALLLAGAGTPILASALGAGAAEPRAATQTVRVGNNFFSPTSMSIRRGRVVTWVWLGGVRHNVTGIRRSGRVVFRSRTSSRAGFRYGRRFRQRASYRVICTIHPRSMRMTVRVRRAMHARHLILIAAPTGHACPPTAITLRRRETVGARRRGQRSLGFWLFRLEHRPVSLRKTQVVTRDYEEEEPS